MSCLFLCPSLCLISLRTGHSELEPHHLARVDGWWVLQISLSLHPNAGTAGACSYVQHFMWVTGVLNSSPHDCKASNLTKWVISPSPKDIFFFKSLYWLRIKWGLHRELKYLWGKILQTYLCLYFFTTSYSPLPGKSHPGSNFNACTPGVSTPRYHGKLHGKLQIERLYPATHLG